jgi:hypothetical protein
MLIPKSIFYIDISDATLLGLHLSFDRVLYTALSVQPLVGFVCAVFGTYSHCALKRTFSHLPSQPLYIVVRKDMKHVNCVVWLC